MEVILDSYAIKISDVALLLIDFDLRFYLACEENDNLHEDWLNDRLGDLML
jgi:hypothetical protein